MSFTISSEARVRVIHALCEGASVNGAARQTGVSKPTILKLLLQVGTGAARLHNRIVREQSSISVQCDEIWSYVGKKERRVTEADPPGVGEAYAFVAIDVHTRLVLSYLVGRRDNASAAEFVNDLRARLTVMPQIVTDGFAPYVDAILGSFGSSVSYAMVNKRFRRTVPFERTCGVSHDYRTDSAKSTKTTALQSRFTSFITISSRSIPKSRRLRPSRQSSQIGHGRPPSLLRRASPRARDREARGGSADASCGASGAARELPNGRGWLRVVGQGSPATTWTPTTESAAKLLEVQPIEEERQGDLFVWAASRQRKKPRSDPNCVCSETMGMRREEHLD